MSKKVANVVLDYTMDADKKRIDAKYITTVGSDSFTGQRSLTLNDVEEQIPEPVHSSIAEEMTEDLVEKFFTDIRQEAFDHLKKYGNTFGS